MAVKATTTQNTDGTFNLVIAPEDMLAEMERQLSIERGFIFFPIFYNPSRIRRMKKDIAEWKKKHNL